MSTNIGKSVGMDADIHEYVTSSQIVFQSLVGVEIELENVPSKIFEHDFKFWYTKQDGSLRGDSVELVFKSPLAGKSIVDALIEVEKYIRDNGITPDTNDRTSVHVHVDVRDMVYDQLYKMSVLYALFERPLFKYAGEDRKSNVFCMSLEQGQSQLKAFHLIPTKQSEAVRINDRYSALNLSAITRFGSIEFRLHRGEWRAAPILRWVNILLSMKKAAMLLPEEVMTIPQEVSARGYMTFLRMIFGKHAKFLEYEGVDNDILEGARLAQDIINMTAMEKASKGQTCKGDGLLADLKEAYGIKQVAATDTVSYMKNELNMDETIIEALLESGLDLSAVANIMVGGE